MGVVSPICVVGAGNIADTHAEAIQSIPGLALAAVVDPNPAALSRFSQRWSVPATYPAIDDALQAGGFIAAHILTSPDLHAKIAAPFVDAGIATLVEKPLASTSGAAEALLAAASRSGAVLGVNQNFIFDPAFQRLRARILRGEIGPLSHIDCVYHAPLRQLEARQFGHWMFGEPKNILLEQAVHPLSQVRALAGSFGDFALRTGNAESIGAGIPFLRSLTASIDAERASATFRFAVGEPFPVWTVTAYGSDGVLVADMYQSRCYAFHRTGWLEAIDQPASAVRTAAAIVSDSLKNTIRYGLAQLGFTRRSDPFFKSMRASIAAFHKAVAVGATPELDGTFGHELVEFCEKLAHAALPRHNPSVHRPTSCTKKTWDVTVLGGTGFIGTHTVSALIAAGYSVCVMARNTRNLSSVFSNEKVTVLQGDARRENNVKQAIGDAQYVINLAHGGGGGSYEEILAAMRGSAELIAKACLEKGISRLIHVGSIASLYLGAEAGVIQDSALSDPQPEKRADYARAKAATDQLLMDMHTGNGLPLVLLRPGLVVGEGASPFHSGLGFYNNDQHCIGWGAGRNALPFVLATDVAEAIVSSLTAPGITGKTFNLVGDVRPTARDYIAKLTSVTGRPLYFHANGPTRLWLSEILKWSIKRIGGRQLPFPSKREFETRTLAAEFDCNEAKKLLKWNPEEDAECFYSKAFDAGADRLTHQPNRA